MNTPQNPYQLLAACLDALPNGFPPAPKGEDLRILEKLYSPEEAELAAGLHRQVETAEELASRLGREKTELAKQLKSMARRGLIKAEPTEGGLAYGLLPFVVGIYEFQVGSMDAELAGLVEAYFQAAFERNMAVQPPVHRVIPVGESVKVGLEVRPFESAAQIVERAQAWGVLDCVCRKQKALIGQACQHPVDICMALSEQPGAFDYAREVKALTREEAHATLRRAAEAGLVHSVSNNQAGIWYICNCCLCSCGILRGMKELGLANVMATSAFVNQVDMDLCILCGACVENCQFDALTMETTLEVNAARCLGCGVCALACPEGALSLVLRPEAEQPAVPATKADWEAARLISRGLHE